MEECNQAENFKQKYSITVSVCACMHAGCLGNVVCKILHAETLPYIGRSRWVFQVGFTLVVVILLAISTCSACGLSIIIAISLSVVTVVLICCISREIS